MAKSKMSEAMTKYYEDVRAFQKKHSIPTLKEARRLFKNGTTPSLFEQKPKPTQQISIQLNGGKLNLKLLDEQGRVITTLHVTKKEIAVLLPNAKSKCVDPISFDKLHKLCTSGLL